MLLKPELAFNIFPAVTKVFDAKMVIVDYTTRENFYEVNTSDVQRQRMALDESISNFCPRLRQSMNRLSRHKVGELADRCFIIKYTFNNICNFI